jgi:hypothetical protein
MVSHTGVLRPTLCAELTAKTLRWHVVDERSLAVDLHHGQPFAVARLERRVPVDRDLLVLELELGAQVVQRRPGPLAQRAARGGKENDLTDRDRG